MTDKKYIQELLDKFISDHYTDDELDELLKYAAQHEDDQQLGELIDQYLSKETSNLPEKRRLRKIISHTDKVLNQEIPDPNKKVKKIYRSPMVFWKRWMTAAAILLPVLFISIYLLYDSPVKTISITASGGQIQSVNLPDGSQAWLNSGATISFPEKFGKNQRSVNLTNGQAFFEVTRNEQKPFVIDAGGFSIEVLGTSFEVTTFENFDRASVSVKTGKVKVNTEVTQINSPTILSANHKATINIATGNIETTEIDSEDIAGWRDNMLVFSADEFGTVVEALQRKYNVRIDLKRPELLHEKITLRLDDQPVQTAIEILSISSNFKYEFINDSTIVIK